jgi:hypothetical protein
MVDEPALIASTARGGVTSSHHNLKIGAGVDYAACAQTAMRLVSRILFSQYVPQNG